MVTFTSVIGGCDTTEVTTAALIAQPSGSVKANSAAKMIYFTNTMRCCIYEDTERWRVSTDVKNKTCPAISWPRWLNKAVAGSLAMLYGSVVSTQLTKILYTVLYPALFFGFWINQWMQKILKNVMIRQHPCWLCPTLKMLVINNFVNVYG